MNAHGERHYAAKLSEADAREILRRAAAGEGLGAIAADYPWVSKVCVHNVIQRKSWQHLGTQPPVQPRRLGHFSTSDLIAELGHRGFRLDREGAAA